MTTYIFINIYYFVMYVCIYVPLHKKTYYILYFFVTLDRLYFCRSFWIFWKQICIIKYIYNQSIR